MNFTEERLQEIEEAAQKELFWATGNGQLYTCLKRTIELCSVIREQIALVDSIIAIVPYVTTTLGSALEEYKSDGTDWGTVHKCRADSSIRQLEELEKMARQLRGEK